MNTSIIRRVLGYVLLLEAAFLLLPCIVALIYNESQGIIYLAVSAACFAIGGLMALKKPASNVFYLKEGCVATALSWIVLSLFGCVPFYLTGEIPRFIDALFETVSGFTTTGASILNDVEALSHCSLFWRSFTHWIGGMGVLVFLLAVVPLSGGSNINLLRAESPGPSVGKLVPKIRYTARLLYVIYFGLTVIELIFLLAGKMPLFDAFTTAFGTAGTGGFGIKNDSLAGYSTYIQWVVTVFMILFGVNFNAYYLFLFKQFKRSLAMEEVRSYFAIIIGSIAIITIELSKVYDNFFDCLTHSSFQVASIITTTGFSSMDFDLWSQASKTVLVLLMFVGACAGSTGGGIKVSRFVLLIKTIGKELRSYIHPKSVFKVKMDKKTVEHETIRATNVYFITFIIVFSFSVFAISFEGNDMVTNFTSVAATINNIGPGLELVGPTRNYSLFNDFSKFVLIFDMLAGRLELFPLLVLFNPLLWKETIQQKAHRISTRRKRNKLQ